MIGNSFKFLWSGACKAGSRGIGIRQINDGEIRLLDWAVGKGLHLMNTCFQKRKSWLITFRSSETETIDYILVNNNYRSSIKNVKVIPGEEIASQNCPLLMDMVFKKKVRRNVKFRKKLKLLKLRVRGERRVC